MSRSTLSKSPYISTSLPLVGAVEDSGPKNSARMSFSMPMTRQPLSIRWPTDCEPIRPPDPVTIAVLKMFGGGVLVRACELN